MNTTHTVTRNRRPVKHIRLDPPEPPESDWDETPEPVDPDSPLPF